MTIPRLLLPILLALACSTAEAANKTTKITQLVDPFLGTSTLWEATDLGYARHRRKRTWGGETYPGASLPFAMVQASPVTAFGSGSGYQYEDSTILAFAHTNKGHWNLLHVPIMPVTEGKWTDTDFASAYDHTREEAHPGYYRVRLLRYGIDAELTVTPHCAYHRYKSDDPIGLLALMHKTNNHVRQWEIHQEGTHAFAGSQDAEGKIYFYAETNQPVDNITTGRPCHITFRDATTLELRIGFSFVSIEAAKANLEQELKGLSFEQTRQKADATWERELAKISVEGGTERQRQMFYSCLYRAMLWPALRSDCDGGFTDARGKQASMHTHSYYTNPSFWDDYRNKLILMALLRPDVAADVARSITDRGEKQGGYMPTFFHGDHAATFISGIWQRGIHDFDLKRAYQLLLNNATKPGRGGRPYLEEYIRQGWIAEKDTLNVPYYDEYKASVTKTIEYAYDDYAVAQVAKLLGDTAHYRLLMQRSQNYRNVFDPQTGFFRGRVASGKFIPDFDPYYPYFAYQFREANAWQSLFFAPHDPEGMLSLYPSRQAVEQKLDSLFSEPWRGYEVENLTGFIGNYCHGNQPGHSQPYTYYFVGRQDKAQAVLDSIMTRFYGMGTDGHALAGMDDAGEMTAWYVMNAIGLYTYSPADPEYLVTVPQFPRITISLPGQRTISVVRKGKGRKIKEIRLGKSRIQGYSVAHKQLIAGRQLTVVVE